MILDKIVASKKKEVAQQKDLLPLAGMERQIAGMPPCRPLAGAVRQKEITLIAEIKRASPSRGMIRPVFDPAEIARTYTGAGAAAISVLTEEFFFGGRLEFLAAVRKVTMLPVLRKDFIIDPYQIYESRFYGSDAVLLIAAILTDAELAGYQRLARELGLSCLVEVHTKEELDRALDSGAAFIGINNRDLRTWRIDLNTTFSLRPYISDRRIIVVSESGIHHRADLLALQEHEVDSALVGEALMRSADPGEKVRELLGMGKA
ncbi:MAG: indole-3-glycerol phosphate synthase TrpC [Bacillota bacterium]